MMIIFTQKHLFEKITVFRKSNTILQPNRKEHEVFTIYNGKIIHINNVRKPIIIYRKRANKQPTSINL